MFIKNSDFVEKIPCYVVDKKLAQFLIMRKKIPVLAVIGEKYYFRKNDLTNRIFKGGKFKGEIPLFYKIFSKIEEKGGEEN